MNGNSPSIEHAESVAFSSSSQPHRIEQEHLGMVIETSGFGGTRHFILPDIGGVLAGQFVTIYTDGKASMTQNYRLDGNLTSNNVLGTCEVME